MNRKYRSFYKFIDFVVVNKASIAGLALCKSPPTLTHF